MWLVIAFAVLLLALVIFGFIQKPKRERAAKQDRILRDAEVTRRGWTLERTIEDGRRASSTAGRRKA
jgi:hypothetical protein